MASEITEEEVEDKEAEKIRIRQLIAYQKSLYFSTSSSSASSSFSSAAASTSAYSSASPRKSSRLLDLMKGGSTSLGRLFDMEHTSLGNYLKDYSVSPIIKPILLWGSDDDDIHVDDPWAEIKLIGISAFGSKVGDEERVLSSKGSFKDEDFVKHRKMGKIRKKKLIRTKSYMRLPRFGLWRCGVFRFRLKMFRKLRIMIRGRKL
ncbi:hypothetical protein BUALT_Bualt11G0128000 [Buddleja alternifolia]|uniref:Uncharacterized protein n=1 Tax=Buddleja alternifolia TaxID=168488 RepID=A0AAV6X1U6_9LAMI|nr:hypothetical protein BUALT_Bualt11G0128000 [Buddleja alternifolia]